MEIAFRVDASIMIGSGHVMRCLTLATALRENGNNVFFICRDYPGALIDFILKSGFFVKCLKFNDHERYATQKSTDDYTKWLWVSHHQEVCDTQKALAGVELDWLIVDHYALDIHWESSVRANTKCIMVIDDLANRKHDCEIILDQNYYIDYSARYNDLVPAKCKKLLGPSFVLLRSEFLIVKPAIRLRKKIKRIFIFLGGADITNETEKVIFACQTANLKEVVVDVVVGVANPYKEKIKKLCDQLCNFNYYCHVDNIAELMSMADLAIAGGGSATWERCFLGLPTLIIAIAHNQELMAIDIARLGCAIYLGKNTAVTEEEIIQKLRLLESNEVTLENISEKASKMLDGNGIERVLKILYETK